MKQQHPLQHAKHLIPLAESMDDLLIAIKDVPFSSDQDSVQGDRRTTQDRSEALSTLMTILSDQAEKDGFRLITINTEPKRVIMACNRQGKPPVQAPETLSLSGESTASSPELTPKKHNRVGTSVRCGCRMRININYHSKLNSWRITSYEGAHNHSYGQQEAPDKSGKRYEISPYMIDRAISRFKGLTSPTQANQTISREDDAAITLAGLVHSPSISNMSPTLKSTEVQQSPQPQKIVVVRRPSNVSMQMSPGKQQHAIHTVSNQEQMQRRRSISDPPQVSSAAPKLMSFDDANGVKNVTGMAVEIDRYAMLHSQFKKLIAIACKKREYTEEVLSTVGRMLDHVSATSQFTQQAPQSLSPVKREGSPLSPINSKLARLSPVKETQTGNGYHLTPLKLNNDKLPKVLIMSPVRTQNGQKHDQIRSEAPAKPEIQVEQKTMSTM